MTTAPSQRGHKMPQGNRSRVKQCRLAASIHCGQNRQLGVKIYGDVRELAIVTQLQGINTCLSLNSHGRLLVVEWTHRALSHLSTPSTHITARWVGLAENT
jgi:hypothetical protein